MVVYRLHELALAIETASPQIAGALEAVLQDLAVRRHTSGASPPMLSLTARCCTTGPPVLPRDRVVLRALGFTGLEVGTAVYLTDGATWWHLEPQQGWGEAYLAPSFWAHPLDVQQAFWSFGLLKLLRPLGLYSLHAAGVVARHGGGLLIVGRSGSGKTTLTLGLVQQGWQYVSDDALLLRRAGAQVEALTLRQTCYLDAEANLDWLAVPGAEVWNAAGRHRRRVEVERAYPGQSVACCLPRVLLFPTIVPQPYSTLQPLAPVEAVRRLLGQSALQVFDRATMGQHLQVLTDLVQQTTSLALLAGRDLHQQPGQLASLLQEALGADHWPA